MTSRSKKLSFVERSATPDDQQNLTKPDIQKGSKPSAFDQFRVSVVHSTEELDDSWFDQYIAALVEARRQRQVAA